MNLLTTTGYKNIEDCNVGEELIAYDVFDGSVIINELLEKQWMSADMFEDEYSIPVQVVDEDGNPVYEQVPSLDEDGNPIYVQIPVVDEEGNPVYEQVPVLDEEGNPVYVQVPVVDEDGFPVYEQVPALNEDGEFIYEQVPVTDEEGNFVYEQVPLVDGEGNPVYEQIPVLDESGYPVFDEDGNMVYENGEQIFVDGAQLFEDGAQLFQNGDQIFEDGEQVFQNGDQIFENGEQVFEDGDPVMTEPVLLKTKKEIFEETYGELSAYRVNDTWDLYWGQSIWANLNVVHAQDLQVGDIVYDDNDNDIDVVSVEKIDVDGWWRLSVSGDHSFIDDGLTLHNASRYWVGGGSSENWNATGNTNWGSTSGGANNASVPTSVDDVVFDGAGVNGNTNSTISAAITILSLDIQTGYTATMTHNAVLTIAGNWTYTGGYTIAGASGINILAASTITSNGRTWPNPLSVAAPLFTVHTIVGNLTVGGLFTVLQAAQTFTTSTGGVLTLQNGIQVNYQFGSGSVTSVDIYLAGGTWSGINAISSTNLYLQGNVTLIGTVFTFSGSITYLSGVITTTGSTLNLQFSATLNTNGVIWNNVGSVNAPKTITLTSNLSMSGLFSIAQNTIINTSNASTWTVGGGLTVNNTLQGTAKVILTGGTWSSNGSGITSNLDIAGNVTVSGTVLKTGGTLTYVSGTVTVTGSTINFQNSCTVSTGGMVWNNLGNYGSTTVTLTSNLFIGGSLTTSGGTVPTIAFNSTSTELIYVSGGMSIGGAVSGNSSVYLTGGTWTATTFINNNLFIQGNVTVSGNVYYRIGTLKYVSGTVTTTGSTLHVLSNLTIDTAGIIWANVNNSFSNATITLLSNFVMTGLLTTGNASGALIINTSVGSTFTVGGGITVSRGLDGTAKVILTGGTWSSDNNAILNNLDLQGNITISGNVAYTSRTITYVSGTITTTGSSLTIYSCTANTGSMFWNNVNASSTINLTSTFNIGGLLSLTGIASLNTSNGSIVNLAGGMNILATTTGLSGTADIYWTGGTWTAGVNAPIMNNLFINGNVTVSGSVCYRQGTMTYLSGVVTTTGSTLRFLVTGPTLNTNGIVWANMESNGDPKTITLTSNLTLSGSFGITGNTTINSTTSETVSSNGINVNNTLQGTAKVILTGGTWSGSAALASNLDIFGNITVSGTVSKSSNTLTYVSGTVTVTGSTLNITGSCTLNTSGMAWNNFTTDVTAKTITLTSNLLINGLLLCSTTGATRFNRTTTETVTCAGGMTANNPNCVITGTAPIYLTGGTWGPGYFVCSSNVFINGDCTIANAYFGSGSNTLKYLSGSVTCTGVFNPFNCTLDTEGILWNIVEISGPGTIQLNSNLNMSGIFRLWYNINFTRTSNQSISCNGITGNSNGVSYTFNIAPDLYINGGVVDNNGPFYGGRVYLNGNVTILNSIIIGGGGGSTPASLIYLSGKPNVSSARLIVGIGVITLINMDKVPFRTVLITQNINVNMNTFFAGTPLQPCSISTTGAPSVIAFQDGFEKIGKFVNVSRISISRQNQLLVITNQRFNTDRSTNIGIRYSNQSPNGVPKNAPSIIDTMTSSALGLISDPNFAR